MRTEKPKNEKTPKQTSDIESKIKVGTSKSIMKTDNNSQDISFEPRLAQATCNEGTPNKWTRQWLTIFNRNIERIRRRQRRLTILLINAKENTTLQKWQAFCKRMIREGKMSKKDFQTDCFD